MKIVSWNVNGLNACLKRGFVEIIRSIKADVVCLQETKLQEGIELELPYHFYWNCSKKVGYSGTAIFCKFNTISVKYGIDNEEFDNEGRVITLEFKHFYLVNVYVPNSQNKLERTFFRDRFDVAFREYIDKLQNDKPVVVCGDFNVAHKEIDIYPENEINEVLSKGFETQERDNFDKLLDLGLVDTFRHKYPDEIQYSWWSNRLGKRYLNQGWRIDYFLVSGTINNYVTHIKYLDKEFGSDHCPLCLEINANKIGVDKLTDEDLTKMWESIDWVKSEDELLDMQQKLTKAVYTKNDERMKKMQLRIANSSSAKALAVRNVTNSDPSAGIDGIRWRTPAEKMRAALLLTSKDYKGQPCRHISIKTKHDTRERKISIPTMYDRAMQVLYAFTLDPVSEANGDRKSFAFRKGRSTQDVHEYIVSCLNGAEAPEYIVVADVKSYYNTICHQWLLDNIPMDKKVLEEFLKSGYIFAGSLFPTEEGISLGANISPILGNMTLDGLQEYLFNNFYNGEIIDYQNGNLIRFADDMLITCKSLEDAEKFLQMLKDFLLPRGLKLSETKTKIVNVKDGFDFMSRHYIKRNGIIITTPSDQAVAKFETTLKELIEDYKGSQQNLIEALNKKLNGFATYHKVTEAMEAFKHIDVTLTALLLEACQKRHPKQAQKKLISKYWYKNGNGDFVYALPSKIECQVMRLQDVFLTCHKKVKTNANPYFEQDYFEERENERAIQNVTGKYKGIWTRQKGKCFYCNKPMLPDQPKTAIIINETKRLSDSNTALIHSCCKQDEFECIKADIDTELLSKENVITLLEDLKENKPQKTESRPFELLREYFFNLEQSPYTLTFDEIEKIMEAKLCSTAQNRSSYWYDKRSGGIANCWIKNGFIIQNLHLDKRYIVFRKEDTNVSKVNIPKVFLTQKIPLDAKYEIESYLTHIKKKYGL